MCADVLRALARDANELIDVERLRQNAAHSLQKCPAQKPRGRGRDDDPAESGGLCLVEILEHLFATDLRHDEVDDQQVIRDVLQTLNGRLTILDSVNGKPLSFQYSPQ